MAYDDEENLFEEEFEFVDEDVEEDEVDELDSDVDKEQESPKPKRRSPRTAKSKRAEKKPAADESEEAKEVAEEAEEPQREPEPEGPPTDHVVHIYEFGKFKRTIQREFTDEDSIKFAEEFNRTSKNYGRHAVPVQRDEEPEPHL